MNIEYDEFDIANLDITLMCPESDCKGYMEQWPDGVEDAFRVDDLLVVPVRCKICGYGSSIHLTMK